MPLFLLLFAAAGTGGLIATVAGGTANKTVPQTVIRPSEGGIAPLPAIIQIPLIIAGTVLAVKYGSKLLKVK